MSTAVRKKVIVDVPDAPDRRPEGDERDPSQTVLTSQESHTEITQLDN